MCLCIKQIIMKYARDKSERFAETLFNFPRPYLVQSQPQPPTQLPATDKELELWTSSPLTCRLDGSKPWTDQQSLCRAHKSGWRFDSIFWLDFLLIQLFLLFYAITLVVFTLTFFLIPSLYFISVTGFSFLLLILLEHFVLHHQHSTSSSSPFLLLRFWEVLTVCSSSKLPNEAPYSVPCYTGPWNRSRLVAVEINKVIERSPNKTTIRDDDQSFLSFWPDASGV